MTALMLVVMMAVIMTMLVGMLLCFMFVLVTIVGMSHLVVLMLMFMLLAVMATHFVFTSFFKNKYNSQLFKFQDKILFFRILLPYPHSPCNFQGPLRPFFKKCNAVNLTCN